MKKASQDVHELILAAVTNPDHELFMGNDPEEGDLVTKLAVVEVTKEWAKTQPWYDSVIAGNMSNYPDHDGEKYVGLDYGVLDEDDVPTHLVRVLSLSNTGWNFLVSVVDGEVTGWHEDELAGNAPGYQGCYKYSGGYVDGEGVGELVNDSEALEWVDALYEDCEDVWI